METIYQAEKTFEKTDFIKTALPRGEYESCVFRYCNFADVNLSEFKFFECTFIGCNFSMANLTKTAFRDARFTDCKMLGLRFDLCNSFTFSVSFDNCTLDHSSFFKTSMKKAALKNSKLHEVDFTQCDLTGAVLFNCDLLRATFDNTVLEKADLRMSFNYSIDPTNNRIKKAKFSLQAVAGLLDMYDLEIS